MTDISNEALLTLNHRLLEAIVNGDYTTYKELCSPELTCIEPETLGNVVMGLNFHKFYFFLPSNNNVAAATAAAAAPHVTMSGAHVRRLSPDAAVISYVRLVQSASSGEDGHKTSKASETRVWQCINGTWLNVHFHRSLVE
eukprot:CAMPEP_0118686852 /NCGR_PEP_ID=MMETSP0800-20121206/8049_1 /TAXON_ID=210618 ORGANISM="Striatella unipunctata, Strain CCMP2910" /NCGR_SAMPLE_ID=MMETSP0800 /ASSEMBLY_ACC=CAM_ASM_000638 /LENGTH=140 /DNA_ID=CAMNT_0006583955 /DNA_START=26 /DNA_END=448 /DNA_ORIENTATION=-